MFGHKKGQSLKIGLGIFGGNVRCFAIPHIYINLRGHTANHRNVEKCQGHSK